MSEFAGPVPAKCVSDVFERYGDAVCQRLLALRGLILDVAAEDGVGPIEECLKWGQAAYLTSASGSGTTVRIDRDTSHGGDFALYVNCKTTLVDEWRDRFPALRLGGTRSLHFLLDDPLDTDQISTCISMALNYHRRKGRRGAA
jgi:hypothetical protein